ncbi:hypothetical protein H5410_001167 [Solanum commersonii]|uniref:Uncharacterized protein n=1 Tax=Solanum commersonii TaxID=4109 RepID=A0A9J6AYT6_SOLCO|nr:hypothetical protein H5410_001167 [Solanum commersonii]
MSNQFLRPDEEQLLNWRNEANKLREMNVMWIEPSHQKGEINLRKWTMNKNNGKASSSYVLVKHWNDIVQTQTNNNKEENQHLGWEEIMCNKFRLLGKQILFHPDGSQIDIYGYQ